MSDYTRAELMQQILQLAADFPALEVTNRKVLDSYSGEMLEGVFKSISRQVQAEINALGLEVPCIACRGAGKDQPDSEYGRPCVKCGGRGRVPSIAGTLLLEFLRHHREGICSQ